MEDVVYTTAGDTGLLFNDGRMIPYSGSFDGESGVVGEEGICRGQAFWLEVEHLAISMI